MNLRDLLTKRLIFISGKGGVGKTTVAVLLGLLASQCKKNVVLVEMNSSSRIPPLFETTGTTNEIIPLAPYLSTINITPPLCFEEYVLRQIRFRTIYEMLFNNAFVMNFVNATPGLAEILMLGKIYDLVLQTHASTNKPDYDLVIVDAPATGHGLSALEVPHILLDLVKMGPLHTTAKKMIGMFSDGSKTALSLVTLAEEMPVNETVELHQKLKGRIGILEGPVFVNRITPPPETQIDSQLDALPKRFSPYRDYHELTVKRAELNCHYYRELQKRLGACDFISLPDVGGDIKSKRDLKPLLTLLDEALS